MELTAQQEQEQADHVEYDKAHAEGPAELTAEQNEQMERDLARLLPDGPIVGDAAKSELAMRRALPIRLTEPDQEAPVVAEVEHADPALAASGYAWRAFPKGGWVYHDKASWMQRVDQGQDFEIPWGCHIVASGWGKCVHYLYDRGFPNGFGSPYMVVYIGGGRFGGRLWYLGHMNYVQIRPGESFHAGRSLGRLYNSLTPGRGWIELGHAANGYPMSMGEGAKWHSLFTTPEWRWST